MVCLLCVTWTKLTMLQKDLSMWSLYILKSVFKEVIEVTSELIHHQAGVYSAPLFMRKSIVCTNGSQRSAYRVLWIRDKILLHCISPRWMWPRYMKSRYLNIKKLNIDNNLLRLVLYHIVADMENLHKWHTILLQVICTVKRNYWKIPTLDWLCYYGTWLWKHVFNIYLWGKQGRIS